jgi:hypothetical protein
MSRLLTALSSAQPEDAECLLCPAFFSTVALWHHRIGSKLLEMSGSCQKPFAAHVMSCFCLQQIMAVANAHIGTQAAGLTG